MAALTFYVTRSIPAGARRMASGPGPARMLKRMASNMPPKLSNTMLSKHLSEQSTLLVPPILQLKHELDMPTDGNTYSFTNHQTKTIETIHTGGGLCREMGFALALKLHQMGYAVNYHYHENLKSITGEDSSHAYLIIRCPHTKKQFVVDGTWKQHALIHDPGYLKYLDTLPHVLVHEPEYLQTLEAQLLRITSSKRSFSLDKILDPATPNVPLRDYTRFGGMLLSPTVMDGLSQLSRGTFDHLGRMFNTVLGPRKQYIKDDMLH